jgi:hypothetical protein
MQRILFWVFACLEIWEVTRDRRDSAVKKYVMTP